MVDTEKVGVMKMVMVYCTPADGKVMQMGYEEVTGKFSLLVVTERLPAVKKILVMKASAADVQASSDIAAAAVTMPCSDHAKTHYLSLPAVASLAVSRTNYPESSPCLSRLLHWNQVPDCWLRLLVLVMGQDSELRSLEQYFGQNSYLNLYQIQRKVFKRQKKITKTQRKINSCR